ncbi:FAD-dependent oxidoreductase [Bdellovibrionota bacterium]
MVANTEGAYDVVIVGAGLAGLTSAYYLKKLNPNLSVVVLERSETAGGLTGDWVDHRLGSKKRLQSPMHMVFRDKYPNILNLVNEIGGILSPLYTGYNIIGGDQTRHRLVMEDWTSRHLPPPLHALGMFSKLKIPLTAKWDLIKLITASTYCARELIKGEQEPPLVPNTVSLESLQLLLNVGPKARDFIEAVTPSIYNLHPWYTAAPRMATVLAGTMAMNKDSLHYHVFGKNYNAAIIDRWVEKLRDMGVEFKFSTEVRRLESNSDGTGVESVWFKSFGPGSENSTRYICENCGAENFFVDRAFCTRCGLDTTLDKIREGKIARPVGSELWIDPEGNGCENIKCKSLITAIYPHMIAKLIPIDSPLRKHPYVRSCFSSRGNQTQLSIARVYYQKQVTKGEQFITGTHNPQYAFNGCQSVYNNFGGEDLDHQGDVIDALLDVGVIRDAHTQEQQTERIVRDLNRVYPDADPDLVEHVSFANIYPDVLYLSEQPAIAGLHRFFNTHRTGAKNWYVAGCHSGVIGIGMESAVEGAMQTVNNIFEDMNQPERVKIEPYTMHAGNKVSATLGKWLLLIRGRGRTFRRLAKTTYSMPRN